MTDRWIMDAKSLASEICSRYFSMLDSCVEHPLNVSNHLKPLILEVTSGIITGSAVKASGTMNNVMSETSTISKRGMARLEAFVDGVSAAIPLDLYKSAVVVPSSSASSLMVDVKSRIFPFWNNSHSPQPRRNSSSTRRYANRYPQIGADNLILRIELYIRSVLRIYGGNTTKNQKTTSMTELTETQQQTSVEECNVHQEPTRLLLRTRVHCICRAFIANVSCVTLVQPVLLRLLGSTTRELLAVQTLSEDLWKAIKREFLDSKLSSCTCVLCSLSIYSVCVLFPLKFYINLTVMQVFRLNMK
jgi:hypothetical protein